MSKTPDKEEIVSVAVDDGFRQTKIVTSTGFKIALPSVARSGFSISRLDGDAAAGGYETEGKRYTVDADIEGEDTRFDDYATSPINRVLIQHAMQLAGLAGRRVALCTGVPFQSYFHAGSNEKNDGLLDAKKASLAIPVTLLNGNAPVDIVRQEVTAQGFAAYVDYMTDASGGFKPNARQGEAYAVVDVGGRTTDCVTVLRGGTGIDHRGSGTANLGVSDIYDLIESELMKAFGSQRIRLSTLDRVAREKRIRWQGEDKDVSAIVDRAVDDVATQVIRELKRRIGKAGEMDAVLLTGGGAILMREPLMQAYPHCVLMDDPAFANARGMLKVLTFGGGHG
ncbi:MAG: plasmid segregation protein ParM domain-containing protein [Rhodanobacter sp.]